MIGEEIIIIKPGVTRRKPNHDAVHTLLHTQQKSLPTSRHKHAQKDDRTLFLSLAPPLKDPDKVSDPSLLHLDTHTRAHTLAHTGPHRAMRTTTYTTPRGPHKESREQKAHLGWGERERERERKGSIWRVFSVRGSHRMGMNQPPTPSPLSLARSLCPRSPHPVAWNGAADRKMPMLFFSGRGRGTGRRAGWLGSA